MKIRCTYKFIFTPIQIISIGKVFHENSFEKGHKVTRKWPSGESVVHEFFWGRSKRNNCENQSYMESYMETQLGACAQYAASVQYSLFQFELGPLQINCLYRSKAPHLSSFVARQHIC